MPIPAPDLKGVLTGKLGFEHVGSGRGPHDKYELRVDGIYVAHTQVPRGRRDLGDPLLAMIARQLGVTRRHVYGMVGCTMDQQSYLEHLGSSS